MKLLRTTKHLMLIILTVLVLVVMLFIPDLFLGYLDKQSVSVKTEKSSPITLELKSGLSLCQKAFIAVNGGREEITSQTKSTRSDMEAEARTICEQLILGPEYMKDAEADAEVTDYLNIEAKNLLPLKCTSTDTNESCIVWYIFMRIEGCSCEMVLDDETKGLIDFSLTFDNYPCDYIRDDLMDTLSWLMEMVSNYYHVAYTHFADEKYQYYIEYDTGFVRSTSMEYDLTVTDNDGCYFFNIFADICGIHFSMTTE